ncbi:hypothetical protein GGI21_002659, partial [Coemansia aciculifera]
DNIYVYFAVIGNVDGGDSLEKFDDAGHELITGAMYALVYPMRLCVVGNNTNAFKPVDKLNEIIDLVNDTPSSRNFYYNGETCEE